MLLTESVILSRKEGVFVQDFTLSTQLPPYVPFPRFLLDIPVSETARLVYCLILSRMLLSRHNGWVDSGNRVYCRYPINNLAADCRKSRSTVITALADLEKHGLLSRSRKGSSRANMLYLKIPETCTSDSQHSVPEKSGKPAPNKSIRKQPNYEYIGDGF